MNINDLLNQLKAEKQAAKSAQQQTPNDDEEKEIKESQKVQITERTTKDELEEKMEELELKHAEEDAEKASASLGVPYINLTGMAIPADALVLVDEADAIRFKLLSFYYEQNRAWSVGVVNYPLSEELQKFIAVIEEERGVKANIHLITEESFIKALKLYISVPKFIELETGVNITEEELTGYQEELTDFRELNEKIQKANLTEVITLIIAAALKFRTSDIHIEAEEKDIKVRFRVDGILNDVAELPPKDWKKLISRVKLLSSLKLNVADVPQDGRFTISLGKDKVDVRVSTLPTAYGESVVMRLLKSSAASLAFEDLGLRGLANDRLNEEIQKTNGMIVTTGPTGSGKTTSLYAILNKLNDEETKIITLENPIEYKLKGINQSQIDHEKGYDFADGLRSILRQDPDIVMVGELRDFETADVAINAALTGHLVISTIHTNSAAGAIPRFLAMGVKPFLLAPALNAIIGQRLCRRLCKHCKEEAVLEAGQAEKVKEFIEGIPESSGEKIKYEDMKFHKSKGCDKCSGLGYKGRVGIYEIFTMNKEIEKLLLSEQVSEYDIAAIAQKNGMLTMMQDGLLKANDGITSVDEVFRVAL